jgi:hypothetical protein
MRKSLKNTDAVKGMRQHSAAAALHWVKREMAIARLYAAFCDGALIALIRYSVSGALSRLIGTDWKQAAFWRETIVGGIVRAQMGEEIAPYEGRRILLDTGAFNAWLKAQQRRRSHPAQAACWEWLDRDAGGSQSWT